MTKPLTLFEHESKNFEWTERDWTLIDRINSALGTDVLRLGMKHGEKRIRASQHVGVIRLKDRQKGTVEPQGEHVTSEGWIHFPLNGGASYWLG